MERRSSFAHNAVWILGIPFLLLFGFIMGQWPPHYPHPNRLMTIAGGAFSCAIWLGGLVWLGGLDGFGNGIRRVLVLSVLSGTLAYVGIHLPELADIMIQDSRNLFKPAAQINGMNWSNLVTWFAMTPLIGIVLDRLERHHRESKRLKELARQAKYASLRGRLDPAFISNTLSLVKGQIKVDARAASATTDKLAILFRQTIELSSHATVPLLQELSFVETYLGIEQARLAPHLHFRVEIPENLEAAGIPPLSLLALAESAIDQLVIPLETDHEIRILAACKFEITTVAVEIHGPSISASQNPTLMLLALRERLIKPEDLRIEPLNEGQRASFQWRTA
jgi:hypothetical protein